MGNNMRVEYRLPETYIGIAGTVEYETDAFGEVVDGKPAEARKPGSAATVAMGIRADSTTLHAVTFEGSGSDSSFSVTHTADQRLAVVSFNTAGPGARVVSAGATVIAFVGGLVATVLGGPGKAVGGVASALRHRLVAGAQAEPHTEAERTPEERARARWAADNGDLDQHRQLHETVLAEAQQALVAARRAAITAASRWEQSEALAQARGLELVIRESRAEVDAVDAMYRAWRAGTIKTRTEAWSFELAIHELPEWTEGPPPAPEEGVAQAVWEHLGVIVQVQLLGNPFTKRTTPPDTKRPRDPRLEVLIGRFQSPEPAASTSEIRWRIPRPARIQIWRRTPTGQVVIDKTMTALVIDRDATEGVLAIDHRLFGESGGTLQFGDLGAPTTITGTSKGAVGAIADALSGVPDQLVAGLESAKKAEATFAGLRDSRARRRLDSLKQQLELTRNQLELKGLTATADDIAKLKRLEQDVLIAAAEESLAGPADPAEPTELEQAKAELELAKVRAALKKVNEGGDVPDDTEVAAALPIEAQLAKLAERVAALEGKG